MQKTKAPQKALMQRLLLVLFAILAAGVAWVDPVDDAFAVYPKQT